MASILLALSDLGTAMPLQEALETVGHSVTWDASRAEGPGEGEHGADVVVLACDDPELIAAAEAWRDADPPPGLVAAGIGDVDRQLAFGARIRFADLAGAGQALCGEIAEALAHRFGGRMCPSYARGALGIRSSTGNELSDAARIVERGRNVDVALVAETLGHYAYHYVSATELIDALREERALEIPEVGLVQQMNGAVTVQTLVQRGGLERSRAAKLLWSLVSAGGATLTAEPPDESTPERRAVAESRHHLRARYQRLARGTLYDVLEVSPQAAAGQIDSAYRYLALRYSPDVLDPLDLGDLTEVASSSWQQIVSARSVLFDPAERKKYNDALAPRRAQVISPWAFGTGDPEAAEAAFRRGQKALIDGEVFKAVSAMATACRQIPEHPDYEVSLCWARFRAELTRGRERREVIAKERTEGRQALLGRRPWARALVALGLLCAADGDSDAAQWHLREALRCDPNLPVAKRLLRRLGR